MEISLAFGLSCHIRQVSASFAAWLSGLFCAYMKNITNAAPRNRSFCRLVRKWFSNLLKCPNGNYQKNFEKLMEKLQDIEDMVEIIARQIARQIKSGEKT